MSGVAKVRTAVATASATNVASDEAKRVNLLSWERILLDLDARGHAQIERVITLAECGDRACNLDPKSCPCTKATPWCSRFSSDQCQVHAAHIA